MAQGEVRIDFDGLPEVLLLLANEPPLPIDDTQVVAGTEVAREQLEFPEVATGGIIQCAALLVHLGQREVHVGNRIVDLKSPVDVFLGEGVLARRQIRGRQSHVGSG